MGRTRATPPRSLPTAVSTWSYVPRRRPWHNTNNYGELGGIRMALSLFITHSRSQPNDTLHSLTDSAHASIAVTKHHKPKSNRALELVCAVAN